MSWAEKMKEWGGAAVSFLSEDGEAIKFIVVGEPVLLISKYKGQETKRIGCPVVTAEGFSIFIAGLRLARRLSKYESKFNSTAFISVRHGVKGDSNAEYDLSVLDDKELTSQLFDIKRKEFKPEMIAEGIADAEDVLKS